MDIMDEQAWFVFLSVICSLTLYPGANSLLNIQTNEIDNFFLNKHEKGYTY